MATFLLTWNPNNWNWANLADQVARFRAGERIRDRWSTGNTKRIRAGDRLYLLRQGIEPRGIVASGIAVSDSYIGEHYDAALAAAGETVNAVDLEFDWLTDAGADPDSILPLGELKEQRLNVNWNTASSGITVSDDAAAAIEHLLDRRQAVDNTRGNETTSPNLRWVRAHWTRDELILALDLYFRTSFSRADEKDPEIVTLSNLLRQLPIHSPELCAQPKFRNPSGVIMKLGNFAAVDPNYPGKGLSAGAKLDKTVFDEFSGDRARLTEVAAAIRAGYAEVAVAGASPEAEANDDEEYAEGKILTRLHRLRERNPKAVEQKKKAVLKASGRLACEVCGFDFARVYGELGEGFIECHHTVPVSELGSRGKTRASDLAVVCPNCHRMIHRRRPVLSIEGLSSVLSANTG